MNVKEKEGDDSGMQTRVWGPAGWLFLHSIAQNYPWHPTEQQKNDYLTFFMQTGNVLPCRYCRESYQEYIKEPGTMLTIDTMASRKTLASWLYKLHNRINKKLGIKCNVTFKQVWDKYESFRSKCTKTLDQELVKKGCIDPQKGYRKKCELKVVSVDKNGNTLSKKSTKLSFGKRSKVLSFKQIKLVSITRSSKNDKKFMAKFEIHGRNRVIHFGARGMSDFTKHKDVTRRNRYISRHRKDLATRDPMRAGYLSMFILWNKPSLRGSIADYRRRLSIYNKRGKFPTKIK